MAEKEKTGSGLYILLIMAFFLGCFLLLVIFGTGIYRSIASRQSENNRERTVLAYLLTVTKMNETDIHTAEDPEYGTILIVEDAGSGYGNRIYVKDGYLVEDYGKVSGKLMPDYATKIGATSVFVIENSADNILKLSTDAGSVFVHSR